MPLPQIDLGGGLALAERIRAGRGGVAPDPDGRSPRVTGASAWRPTCRHRPQTAAPLRRRRLGLGEGGVGKDRPSSPEALPSRTRGRRQPCRSRGRPTHDRPRGGFLRAAGRGVGRRRRRGHGCAASLGPVLSEEPQASAAAERALVRPRRRPGRGRPRPRAVRGTARRVGAWPLRAGRKGPSPRRH